MIISVVINRIPTRINVKDNTRAIHKEVILLASFVPICPPINDPTQIDKTME